MLSIGKLATFMSLSALYLLGSTSVFAGTDEPVRAYISVTQAAAVESTGGMYTDPKERLTPMQRVKITPKGELRNPYANDVVAAEEGQRVYRSLDCSGCHGGGGGGGMAAPLTNEIWIYGDEDDTLFRLIALGTGRLSIENAFEKEGYVRKGWENVMGPMPPYGEIIETDQDIWKIIAWIRSINRH